MTSPRLTPLAFESRLRWLLIGFVAVGLTIYGRLIVLEAHEGSEYRTAAAEPVVRRQPIAATRGRILARDGTVLAADESVVALAVHYRWLEEPANPRWLRQMARSRLTPRERRDARRVAAEQEAVLDERRQLAERLTTLCGLSPQQWQQRVRRIQQRVETIAQTVNARHGIVPESEPRTEPRSRNEDETLLELVGNSIVDALFALDAPPPPVPITVMEHVSEHIVFESLPLEAVAEISANPQRFPGVKLEQSYRRTYPGGGSAAHAVGFVGIADSEDSPSEAEPVASWIGKSGLEREYDRVLRPTPGLIEEELDLRGRVKSSQQKRPAAAGSDVVLTIDPQIQRAAELLLDDALRRRLPSGNDELDRSSGGAVVVLDVHRGEMLAAATAPRFDPNGFIRGDAASIRSWLNDPGKPMLDRTIQMALPPGSIFKIVTAAAILNAGVNPRAPVDCLGYLHQPDSLRCAIFRRTGVGHGPVTLSDALARSCNVYFFHHAEQLGATTLIDWARKFGLGRPGGIELAGEVTGNLPTATDPGENPNDPRPMAIGQSTITTTPLQMAVMAAAVANGGTLVKPTIVGRGTEGLHHSESGSRSLSATNCGLTSEQVAAIQDGMRLAVADEQGTAHSTVDLAEVAISGKTGTAQTGGGRPDHAWFVGYAPADRPQIAFAIVLEHGGDGGLAAGPIAKQLVAQLHDAGYFSAPAARSRLDGRSPN